MPDEAPKETEFTQGILRYDIKLRKNIIMARARVDSRFNPKPHIRRANRDLKVLVGRFTQQIQKYIQRNAHLGYFDKVLLCQTELELFRIATDSDNNEPVESPPTPLTTLSSTDDSPPPPPSAFSSTGIPPPPPPVPAIPLAEELNHHEVPSTSAPKSEEEIGTLEIAGKRLQFKIDGLSLPMFTWVEEMEAFENSEDRRRELQEQREIEKTVQKYSEKRRFENFVPKIVRKRRAPAPAPTNTEFLDSSSSEEEVDFEVLTFLLKLRHARENQQLREKKLERKGWWD